jgi:CMP-N-acetylneuraminic acid synthetase
MATDPTISIIVRTKNEERWIASCLDAIFAQDFKDFEVIVVDDKSNDKTLEILQRYAVKLTHFVEDYLPGRALNTGIRESRGSYIVCLSGHCVPTNQQWLSNLLRNFSDDKVAGVYGRQEPLAYSSPRDKRDLWTIFGLDRKVQFKDSFFHNANSMIRRSMWDQHPFDEQATNIEDRLWAKEILACGYCIVYEPEASVYHWHGIHQNQDENRCQGVVRILELLQPAAETRIMETSALNTLAIIPVRGEVPTIAGRSLLQYTIERAKESSLIRRVIVSTESSATAQLAESLGAEVPFLRPPELSKDIAGLEAVYAHVLDRLGSEAVSYENVLALQITHPFRPRGFVDALLQEMLYSPVDTVVPVRKDWRLFFRKNAKGDLESFGDGLMPQKLKEPFYASIMGLGILTKVRALREGSLLGDRLGIYVVNSKFSELEVGDEKDAQAFASLLGEFWENEPTNFNTSPIRFNPGTKQESTVLAR